MAYITDYHIAEQALADSERRICAIFEAVPSGIIISNQDDVFQQSNLASGRLLGYSVDEHTGEHFSKIMHPDDRAYNIHLSDRLIVGDISNFDLEKRFLPEDGSVLRVHLSVSTTHYISGRPRSHLIIVEDIFARKEALAELVGSQARLLESQHVAHIGNWEYGETAKTRHLSNECYRIFGRDKKRFDPSGELFFDCIHPDNLERFVRNMVNLCALCEPHSHEYRIIRANGDVRTLREHSVFEYNAAGELVHRASTVQDIPGQKQAEEQLH